MIECAKDSRHYRRPSDGAGSAVRVRAFATNASVRACAVYTLQPLLFRQGDLWSGFEDLAAGPRSNHGL
jgi:hypothetical protein